MHSMHPNFGHINRTLIYNAWNNDFEMIRSGKFCELFTSQALAENITIGNLCIFDCTNEGIGISDMNTMVSALTVMYPTLEIRVLFNIPVTHIRILQRQFDDGSCFHGAQNLT